MVKKKVVKKVVRKTSKKVSKVKPVSKSRIVSKQPNNLNRKMKVLSANLLSFFLFFVVTFILSYVFKNDALSNLLFGLAALVSAAVVVALLLVWIAFKLFKKSK